MPALLMTIWIIRVVRESDEARALRTGRNAHVKPPVLILGKLEQPPDLRQVRNIRLDKVIEADVELAGAGAEPYVQPSQSSRPPEESNFSCSSSTSVVPLTSSMSARTTMAPRLARARTTPAPNPLAA